MKPRLFAFGQLHLHLGRQNQRDFILDSEDVVDGTIIALGPDVRAVIGVYQLRRDPKTGAALANASRPRPWP